MSSRRRRWVLSGSIVLACLVGLWFLELRPDTLRQRITRTLAARMNAEVAISDLAIGFVPRLRLTASGVTLRVKGRPELPPFISIDRVSMNLGPLSIARGHVDTVYLDGLKIQVPPKDARDSLGDSSGPPEADGAGPTTMPGGLQPSKVVIEHVRANDAVLAFYSDKPRHRPHTFEIRTLELEQLGFDRVVPFRAELINPVPRGLVQAHGTFGPWAKEDPARTPVSGDYSFSDVDLSTIDGIRGTLSSIGSFHGLITSIDVNGTTSTPDFNLDLDGTPQPLATTFSATVDGTNGTTILHKVDATLAGSSIAAKGSVVNRPGPTGHDVDLEVAVPKGRIEDLLALVTPAKSQPVATGRSTSHATVHLPSGDATILARLIVKGDFSLDQATFQRKAQERIREFSRRTQGKSADEMDGTVASNVKGKFALARGVLRFGDLSFEVPGADVALTGSCNLRDRALDLAGTLRMQATVSQAVGGFKSMFLKLVDPFFKRRGKTQIPIKIEGTIENPKPGLRLGKG